jgi:Lipocalin-like domain
MKRFSWLAAVIVPALLFGVLASPNNARAQTVNAQLTGSSWTLVSARIDRTGKTVRLSNPHLQGFLMFDGSDHFLIVIARSESSGGQEQTAGKDHSMLHRTIACFGTYSIDEANQTIAAHIESSTLPKWSGSDQKLRFTIAGGVLKWINSSPAGAARSAELAWKRVK